MMEKKGNEKSLKEKDLQFSCISPTGLLSYNVVAVKQNEINSVSLHELDFSAKTKDDGNNINNNNENNEEDSGLKVTSFKYSKDGMMIGMLLGSGSDLSLYSPISLDRLISIKNKPIKSDSSDLLAAGDVDPKAFVNLSHFQFSPLGNYLVTWERYVKGYDNSKAWRCSDGSLVCSWIMKSFSRDGFPSLKFSADESVACKPVSTEVQFWSGFNDEFRMSDPTHRIKISKVSGISFSPLVGNNDVATFVPESKGVPAQVTVWAFPSMRSGATKSFYKADEVKMLWNSLGTAILVLSHCEVDRTGKSYYGETGLHFVPAISGGRKEMLESATVPLDGPLHDCSWSPSGDRFIVIHGVMPTPQTTIFDLKCRRIADLGAAARNSAFFSPNGRILAVAGFGSLPGQIDIWDQKRLKRIGSAFAPASSFFEWAPDSRHFLTGVLAPRMHQGNCWKVWRYDGTELKGKEIVELCALGWRPVQNPTEVYEDLPPSPRLYKQTREAIQQQQVTVQSSKYVAPHARRKQQLQQQQQSQPNKQAIPVPIKYSTAKAPNLSSRNLPPGAEQISKSGKKNAKRRAARKAKQQVGGQDGQETQEQEDLPVPPQEVDTATPVSTSTDPLKKIKQLEKKLKQIQQLKIQQEKGASLNNDQLAKLRAEGDVLGNLKSLKDSLGQ